MTKHSDRLYNYQKSFNTFLRENVDHYLREGVKLKFASDELLVSCAESLRGVLCVVRQALGATRGGNQDDLP